MTDTQGAPHSIIPKERIGNVIDAIYAFSMTLLVTTISVPPKYMQEDYPAPVKDLIQNVFPDLIHYFIAFIILALFWYFEHQRFRHLAHLDRPLLVLNIASLAFVCLIPFTTNVAGDFPLDYFGAVLFELNIFVIGLIALLQWIYIGRWKNDLMPDLSRTRIQREIRWTLVFPLLAVAGIVLALLNVTWSSGLFLLAPFIMAVLYWKDPVNAVPGPKR